jgi:hypothetical protein
MFDESIATFIERSTGHSARCRAARAIGAREPAAG